MEQRTKKRKLWMLIIIIPIITLLIAFLVFSFLTKTFIFKEKERPIDTGLGFTHSIEELVINLKEDRGYLKTKISLGYGVKKDAELVQLKEIQIIDEIICILRSKTREDIMPVENTDDLKTEIKNELNKIFEEDIITDIYMTEFLIQ